MLKENPKQNLNKKKRKTNKMFRSKLQKVIKIKKIKAIPKKLIKNLQKH